MPPYPPVPFASLPARQELVGRKRGMHLAAFRFLVDEIARDLRRIAAEEGAEARLAGDGQRVWGGKTHTIAKLVSRIVGLVEEVLARHAGLGAEAYTDDGAYRHCVRSAPF